MSDHPENSIRRAVCRLTQVVSLALFICASMTVAFAQQTTGNIRGIVKDPAGAVVSGAKVTATDKSTNTSTSTVSTTEGEFKLNNLLVGEYQLKIEAPNFRTLTLNDVRVALNQTTDVPAQLTVGIQGEVVEVSAGGAELVQTTTVNLSKGFNARQVVELPQTTITTANDTGSGIYNLALLSPNVSSSGGVGLGTGGSVGGQRPRQNNFVVDGVDNNRKDISGPAVYISPETVAEFSILTNQFSAEFARSTGGQFITATKSGTNEFHGTGYGFFRNRFLNALDTSQKNAGFIREDKPGFDRIPRYDYERYGFNIGGPVYLPLFGQGGPAVRGFKDRLFFFTSYEGLQIGNAAAPAGLTSPTAAGFAKLGTISGLSAANLALFRQYVPVSPAQGSVGGQPQFICVGGAIVGDDTCAATSPNAIPVGPVSFGAPNFSNQRNFVLNLDYTQSENTQHHSRFIYNRLRNIDNNAVLPVFYNLTPTDGRLFSYTLMHNFSAKLTNELRFSYRRYVNDTPAPDIGFPIAGFDSFPNIGLTDLGIDIGPDQNAPQSSIENSYQLVDNVSYLVGNHSFKFGVDTRKIISPQTFVQRVRGDYQYGSTDRFLRDLNPDILSERNVGASTFYGDQILFFGFAQDEWRFRPNLTLNLGLNYSYQQVPFSARRQTVNSIASVPGLLEFNEPKAQKKNFGPRIGIAYSPNFSSSLLGRLFGSNGQSSIRAGFSMAYDVIVDNLYILSNPPQAQITIDDPDVAATSPNFLARGGIPSTVPVVSTSPADARANTASWIPDQQVPYAISWNITLQRQFQTNWALETRYLGTRGIHLPTQNRINVQNRITDTLFLPTLSSRPTQAQIDAMPLTLATLLARPRIIPAYANAGFTTNVVAFLPNGNSTYHAFSAQLTRRFTKGLQMSGAYTWSHLLDDSTAEVFSTVLSPRRVEDFQNLRPEKANSALDRRHRFVFSGIYDVPMFFKSSNKFMRTLLGGFSLAGALTLESGEPVTVLSGSDANLNGDPAGDRTIFNVNGTKNTSSSVTPLLKTCTAFNTDGTCSQSVESRTVGYLATNPNAQYIQAGPGAKSTAGRNTMVLPGINNVDFSISKNFAITEVKKIQFRADMINTFNHPQYVPGTPNSVTPIATTAAGNLNTAGSAQFNDPSQVFSSNPRIIQMSLRFVF